MQAARREEGYGDLVGLTWTAQHHPQHCARLHAWLVRERSTDLVHGRPHDTLAWVQLAGQGTTLARGPIFATAAAVWMLGLDAND